MELKKITIFILFLLALLYFRTFAWLVNAWLSDPYYTHGFLVPIISGFIAWRTIRKLREGREGELEPFKPGIYIFAFGLLLHAIGLIKLFPFLAALSFLFTLSGLILYFYGKTLMRSLLFPISFLIFAIPVPLLILEHVAFVLQSFSVRSSASLTGLLGIPVERMGSEIHLQTAAFSVGLPCSGMNTLISLLTLAAILIYLLRCPGYKKAVLFCAAIPIAIGANILRIVSILLVGHAYGAEVAMKFFHYFSSILLFLLALVCLFIMVKVMRCTLFYSEED